MLRDLVSMFGRPSKSKLRRREHGNGLRNKLSIESLEQRMVLSATLPTLQMAPTTVATTGQFVSLNYLARFTDQVDAIQMSEFGVPEAVLSTYSCTIDWGDGSVPTEFDFPYDLDDPDNPSPAADASFAVPVQGVIGATIDGKIKGRHTYATAGDYDVTVYLTETDDVESTTVSNIPNSFTISVKDAFVPEPGDQQFQFNPISGAIAEGSTVSATFKIPESVNAGDIGGWTVSWGDHTQFYGGSLPTVEHIYADFYEQFNTDNLDNHIGNVYYISAHVHLNAGGVGDATYESGIYGASFAFSTACKKSPLP